MKTRSKAIAAALVAVLSIGSVFTAQAMPTETDGTWYGDSMYPSQPQNPYWDGHVAHWNSSANAVKYEIEILRNGAFASRDTTSNTHISYKTIMQQSGEYTFRVRAISGENLVSEWSGYSAGHHVSGYNPETYQNASHNQSQGPSANPYSPGSTRYGWVNSSDGFFWLWKDNNGQFVTNCFRTIDGNTYYFDNNGYMFTGWMCLDNSLNYYFYSNGVMAVGEQNIDGRDHYFNASPGPSYGVQER
ncbi:MAG: hypothetical protein PHV18_09975 [Lachnospiraceae bacterium]|nr:hypothetical protein [Lachnospiraceae bacterium]